MGVQISPLFQAVEDQARKYNAGPKSEASVRKVFEGARICWRAKKHKAEIIQFRRNRELLRKNCNQEGKRNGHLKTGEIHTIEWEAAMYLCPLLKTADWQAQIRGIDWVLEQPWCDFHAAPIERTRF